MQGPSAGLRTRSMARMETTTTTTTTTTRSTASSRARALASQPAQPSAAGSTSRVPRASTRRWPLDETVINQSQHSLSTVAGKRKVSGSSRLPESVRVETDADRAEEEMVVKRARYAQPNPPTPPRPHRQRTPEEATEETRLIPVTETTTPPHTPPSHFIAPTPYRIVTPVLPRSERPPVLQPTPARVLLRHRLDDEGDLISTEEETDEDAPPSFSHIRTSPVRPAGLAVLARPPTPPRMAERTERNGYTTPAPHRTQAASPTATPKIPGGSPEPIAHARVETEVTMSIRRLDFSKVNTPRKTIAIIQTPSRNAATSTSTSGLPAPPGTSSAVLSTPSVAKMVNTTPSRPILESSLFTAPPKTPAATPNRQIAPLPLRTPGHGAAHSSTTTTTGVTAATPGPAPWASVRKFTVPIPFKGAGGSTKASEERERAIAESSRVAPATPRPLTMGQATPHQPRTMPRSTVAPTPAPAQPTTSQPLPTINVIEDMEVDETAPLNSLASSSSAPIIISTMSLPSPARPSLAPSPASPQPTTSGPSVGSAGKKPSLAGLSTRRPPTRLSTQPQPEPQSIVETSDATDRPVRRKPSYPSTLGSGPQARPSARVVSNPMLAPRSVSAPSPFLPLVPVDESETADDAPVLSTAASTNTSASSSTLAVPQIQQRAVSDPTGAPKPRTSLSMSQRREGFALETNKSLNGLSEALAKLKARRQTEPAGPARSATSSSTESGRESVSAPSRLSTRPSVVVTPDIADGSSSRPNNLTASTSSNTTARLPTAVHRPRTSLALQPLSRNSLGKPAAAQAGQEKDGLDKCAASQGPGSGSAEGKEGSGTGSTDRSIAALMASTSSTSTILKGVVAFVDVKTGEGDDASAVFTDMMRSCGAKVLTRPTESCTHIVYRAGKPSTLAWYRRQEEPRPHIVGITWVTRSKEAGRRLAENSFAVEVEEEDVFQKRRKSMEPKSLAASQSGSGQLSASTSTSARLLVPDTGLSVAAARRRTLMYAPKVSSPLKRSYLRPPPGDDE